VQKELWEKNEIARKKEEVAKKKVESARRKETARSEWKNKGCTKSQNRSNDAATNDKRYCVDGDDDCALPDEGSVAPAKLLKM